MKKMLLTMGLSAIMAVGAFAGQKETKFAIGAANATIEDSSFVQYGIGYTSDYVTNAGYVIGVGSMITYGSMDDNATTTSNNPGVGTVDLDLRIGYKLTDSLKVVGIASVAGQYIENEGAYGFGGGGALEYSITKNIALEANYKAYSMTGALIDYDYSVAGGALKIAF